MHLQKKECFTLMEKRNAYELTYGKTINLSTKNITTN